VAALAEEQRGPVPAPASAPAPGGARGRGRDALAGIEDGVEIAVDPVVVAVHRRRRNRGEWGPRGGCGWWRGRGRRRVKRGEQQKWKGNAAWNWKWAVVIALCCLRLCQWPVGAWIRVVSTVRSGSDGEVLIVYPSGSADRSAFFVTVLLCVRAASCNMEI
jgi:hypothetical protein